MDVTMIPAVAIQHGQNSNLPAAKQKLSLEDLVKKLLADSRIGQIHINPFIKVLHRLHSTASVTNYVTYLGLDFQK